MLLLLACTSPVDPPEKREQATTDTGHRREDSPPGDTGSTGSTGSTGLRPLSNAPLIPLLGDLAEAVSGAAVADGFGPRLLSGATDFHPGLDLIGERGAPIRAISGGVVERISLENPDAGESNHVYVRHSLAAPIPFHGQQVQVWYSIYGHLDRIDVQLGDRLAAGDLIGAMGDSGGASTVHLHLEIRLGTWCSLAYQLSAPDSDCATGYDPAINPLYATPGSVPGGLGLIQEDRRTFLARTFSPDLDIARVAAGTGADTGADTGIVDLDLREGLDASSDVALDQLDLGWLRIEPLAFDPGGAVEEWRLRFAEPPSWLEVTDIHGVGWRLTQ